MSVPSNRREALTAAAAVGGLFAFTGGSAHAETERDSPWPGEWFSEGKLDRPCAVFQYGRVFLLVNEHMHLAVGRLLEGKKIVVKDALVWTDKNDATGFQGVLSKDGKTILWQNNTTWRKP